MDAIINVVTLVFWGLVMFTIIVVVHEFGHFTVARLFKMRVREFMVGLPGPNIGFRFRGTKFGVTPFLLGGYALINGMQDATESPTLARSYELLAKRGHMDTAGVQALEKVVNVELETDLDQLFDWGTIERKKRKDGLYVYEMPATDGFAQGEARALSQPTGEFIAAEKKHTYLGAPWYQRVLMLLAGAAFNLLFAIIVLTVGFSISGQTVYTATLEMVEAGSPAAIAGVLAGDQIVGIDGVAVSDWESLTTTLSAHQPGDQVDLDVLRQGQAQRFAVTLGANPNDESRAFLGVMPGTETVAVSLPDAFVQSVSYIGLTAVAIAQLFTPHFGEIISQSTSVVGVSYIARAAAEAGFLPFIEIAAILSISIGLMNLLPLPPLDGGKIVIETVQRISRRIIPARVVTGISVVCMAALIGLFLLATSQDIQRFVLGG
jgi:regulator of sigma E protease